MSLCCNAEKGGGLFSGIEHERAVAAKSTGAPKLRDVIPRESSRPFFDELTGYAARDWKTGGKPTFAPVLMFKVLMPRNFHGMSNDAAEEQVFDRTSFKSFFGLCDGDDIVDARTLWDLKQRIAEDGREGALKLFERVPRWQRRSRDPFRRSTPTQRARSESACPKRREPRGVLRQS